MRWSKKIFLVHEEDLEAIDYDEPEEEIFRGESIVEAANKVPDFEEFKKQQEAAIKNFNEKSIIEAANKVFNFDEFKKQQEAAINNFNENLLENAETINYVDDIVLNKVRENKNLTISTSKIREKYRKLRKRKAANREKQINKIIKEFKMPKKREK